VTFDVRFVVVVLAAFASANLAAACLTLWQWRRATPPAAPQDRASFLFQWRLLPVAASLLWSGLATVSFFIFEPRRNDEEIGLLLPVLAAVGAALWLAAGARLALMTVRHARIVRGWLSGAEPIALDGIDIPTLVVDSDFPIVAVIGSWRPKLLIARSVLDACPADEFRAIVDHEYGHIQQHDNIRRTLLLGLPDPLTWIRAGRAMDAAWHDAAEEVADETSGRTHGDAGRMALASALIRVAKLVPAGRSLTAIPASALYRGEPLEQRVRRLLDPIPPRPRAPRRYQWAGLAAFILGAAILLNPIHELLEVAVTFLP
jgi:Zn-dependent protease with chaperone function